MVYVFESDFSYIIPPLDDNKRLLSWVSQQ